MPEETDFDRLDIGSQWILSRLSAAADEINKALAEYRFNDAAGSIYQFIWHELCDWYIEMVKPLLYGESGDKDAVKQCLLVVLETTLRLLHPFMPYVTEEIWQHLPAAKSLKSEVKTQKSEASGFRSIMVSRYPASLPRDEAAEREMAVIMEAVTGIRTIRGELNLSPSRELTAFLRTLGKEPAEILERNLTYLEKLAKADVVEIGESVVKPRGSAAQVKASLEVYVPLEGLLNIDVEVDRLRKEEAKVEQTLVLLNKKLLNEDFLKRAPEAVVSKEKEKHEECLRKRERIREHIKKLYEAGGRE